MDPLLTLLRRYCQGSSVKVKRRYCSRPDLEMSNDKPVIYHNPRCSKSRETLQLLNDRGVEPEIIEYLENPPNSQELRRVVELLGVRVRDLVRTTESIYQEVGLDDDNLSDDELIEAICENPALLQRPIVISGNRAVIGRPPSRILEIIA